MTTGKLSGWGSMTKTTVIVGQHKSLKTYCSCACFFLSKSKWIFQHFSIFMENYSMIFKAKSVKNLQNRISSKHSFENFYLNCFMIMPSLLADLTRTENVVYFEHFSPRFRLNKCVHTNYFVYILITKLSISSSDVVKNVAKISADYIYFLSA